jgi:type IV pilus assembly protein PilE
LTGRFPKYDQPEKLERKNMRNPKGFTLIEAIISAVIVAILAAVAIPFYTGYVTSARQDRVNNLAQTAAAAANAYVRKTGGTLSASNVSLAATTGDVSKLNLFVPDAAEYTISITQTGLTGAISVTDSKSIIGMATY